jgi:hypothetical protein
MKNTSKQWTVLFLITAINVLVALVYAIAGVVSPDSILPVGTIPTEASTIFALYAGARTIPLAVLVIYAILAKHRTAVIALGVLAGFVQFFDGFVGIYQHDMLKSIGPFFLSALQFAALWRVWKSEEILNK